MFSNNNEEKINWEYVKTIELIKELHKDQTDKIGQPYYMHPIMVSVFMGNASSDEIIAALLHDVVEDCGISVEDLRVFGYNENIIEMVRLVSRTPDIKEKMTYLEWIQSIVDSGNTGAMRIKYADNLHNSLPWRLNKLPTEEHSIYNRYMKSMRILAKGLGIKSID